MSPNGKTLYVVNGGYVCIAAWPRWAHVPVLLCSGAASGLWQRDPDQHRHQQGRQADRLSGLRRAHRDHPERQNRLRAQPGVFGSSGGRVTPINTATNKALQGRSRSGDARRHRDHPEREDRLRHHQRGRRPDQHRHRWVRLELQPSGNAAGLTSGPPPQQRTARCEARVEVDMDAGARAVTRPTVTSYRIFAQIVVSQ